MSSVAVSLGGIAINWSYQLVLIGKDSYLTILSKLVYKFGPAIAGIKIAIGPGSARTNNYEPLFMGEHNEY